ncbi:MASE1 domain-containing protein [Dyella sp. 2HG41-7]|uniref:MASE1 domain-containing protein n=1 Tax=Dyella sp. 2HG41-7 TaxID=2883239 RepID=UPI001F28313C|nr:MASE1 domain-containing protein [Dyella sp. 2HG41-7]
MLRLWIEKQWRAHRWMAHVAVALGYALVYIAIRPLSVTFWPFAAGLRVAFLMLTPRRHWPAMVVGEVFPLTYFSIQCLSDLGLTWVILDSIPLIIFAMPVISWFRNRAGLFPTPGMVNLTRLLACMLVLSAMWASINYTILSTVRLPSGSYAIPPGTWMKYFIGTYAVLLLVVPWIIMIRIRGRRYILPLLPLRTPITHPLVRDVGIAVLILAGLIGWYRVADASTQATPLMALFLPAVWLTLKHGWRASVVGGTLSLACICALLAWGTEPFNQQAQTLMAMAVTSLYFFGARISEQGRDYGRAQQNAHQDKDVAQNALALGEERLQRTAHALECVGMLLRMDYTEALKCCVAREEWEYFNSQAERLHRHLQHLAESLYPSAWRERGLGAALHETIGKALREAGIIYDCDMVGRELRFLSPALQAALYRVACDAVTALSSSPACTAIRMAIRTGRRQGRRWVVLRIHSVEDNRQVAYAVANSKREGVADVLGAGLRTVEEARKLVLVFDGLLDLRSVPDGKRISMLLCDQVPSAIMPASPIRLWVE